MTASITTSWMNALIVNIKAETEVILRQCRSATCTLTMASQQPELCGYRENMAADAPAIKCADGQQVFRCFLR